MSGEFAQDAYRILMSIGSVELGLALFTATLESIASLAGKVDRADRLSRKARMYAAVAVACFAGAFVALFGS